jgi:hypothetical protein
VTLERISPSPAHNCFETPGRSSATQIQVRCGEQAFLTSPDELAGKMEKNDKRWQPGGAELPAMGQMSGEAGENRDRLISIIKEQYIELAFTEKIAPFMWRSTQDARKSKPFSAEAPHNLTRATHQDQARASQNLCAVAM